MLLRPNWGASKQSCEVLSTLATNIQKDSVEVTASANPGSLGLKITLWASENGAWIILSRKLAGALCVASGTRTGLKGRN